MAKDMLDAIYDAEKHCREREANAKAESAQKIEQAKENAKQLALSAKEKAQNDAEKLFDKTLAENEKELKKASESSHFECDVLSQTANKNRSRVISEALQRLTN